MSWMESQPTEEKTGNKDENQNEKYPSALAFYESNSALKEIGTAEMYQSYLETIFPDSNYQELVYRGTGDSEDFVTAAGSNQTIAPGAVFFTSNATAADLYRRSIARKYGGEGKTHLAKINLRHPFVAESPFSFRDFVILDKFIKEHSDLHTGSTKEFLINVGRYEDYRDTFSIENSLDEFNRTFSLQVSNNEWKSIKLYLEERMNTNAEVGHYLQENYDGIEIAESEDNMGPLKFDQLAVWREDQIHILGSPKDLEKFREFVANHQNDSSKT